MNHKQLPNKVQVELSGILLAKLISSGVLHGNECKCLDANAKHTLWQSLLNSSIGTKEGELCL